MNVGNVDVDKQFEPSPELEADMERLPHVADALTDLVFREAPTVAVSALVTVLGRVLLAADSDPLNAARIAGEAVQNFVRGNLHVAQAAKSDLTDGLPVRHGLGTARVNEGTCTPASNDHLGIQVG